MRWFVDTYRARGVEFDRILAWESTPQKPAHLFRSFPQDILVKLSYFNVGVDPSPSALHHPWSILKALVEEEDFVVVKLDIDTASVEEELVLQLMRDAQLCRLIDEFYFEHHTTGNPMMGYWRDEIGQDITDSYAMFAYLRELGVRAHSWV